MYGRMKKNNCIYNYSDYQTFLKDFHQRKKNESSHWSLGVFARELGLSSKSSISMLLNGQRHPSLESTQKLAQYFKFNAKESEFFKVLINLKKFDKNPELRVLMMERLKSLHPHKEFKLLDDESFSAVAGWYYYAIREMVTLEGFQEDEQWIHQQLTYKVSIKKIKSCINKLLKLDLLVRDETGRLQQAVGSVTTSDNISSEAIKRFHIESIAQSQAAVRKFSVKDRFLSAVTLSIKKENLDQAKQLIREFEDRLILLCQEEQGDMTIQLNTQLFPLTKPIIKKENMQ